MAKKAISKLAVHLTERSLRDIAAIEAYSIKEFGKQVAEQYIEKFDAAIKRIKDNPELLREEPSFHKSLRFYRVEKHLLVCETGMAEKIIVLTVLHGAMDFPSRLAELETTLSTEVQMLLEQLRRTTKK